jgi:hypothetical protein
MVVTTRRGSVSKPIEDPQFFFRQKETLDALEELSSATELVIYCGAGVSLDRTNVTWFQLINRIYRLSTTLAKPTPQIVAIESLLASSLAPEQLASILVQAFAKSGESENNFLGSKLKEIIYTENGWNPGLALRNILRAAMVASGAGRKVTIVTTNYDDYIEQAFRRHRGEMITLGTPVENVPGMTRWVLQDDGKHTDTVIEAAGSKASNIELIYLHGRVDDASLVEGRLVLSERSYAEARERSSKLLLEQFDGPDKAVLVVGASLTDAPLIYALATTRDQSKAKFALLPMPTSLNPARNGLGDPKTADARAKAVGDALGLRGDHLGVKILRPLDHFQTAQFLEELRVGLSATRLTGDPKHYRVASNEIAYSRRLENWHSSWEKRSLTLDPEATFQTMRLGLQSIVTDIFGPAGATSGELLRLEVWARSDPKLKDSMLSLWATSVGPVIDGTARRHEKITVNSRNASVRSLMAGRPLLLNLQSLGHDDQSSRWKSFFSAPIYAEVPVIVQGEGFTANLPVGVITLASTWYSSEGDAPTSAMAEKLSVPDLTNLKNTLIGIGREVLGRD